eukprot:1851700-Alexandrium_andersonii.AAC.1
MPGITALHSGQNRWQVSIHPPGTRSKSWAKSRAKAVARASRSSGVFIRHLWNSPETPRSCTTRLSPPTAPTEATRSTS